MLVIDLLLLTLMTLLLTLMGFMEMMLQEIPLIVKMINNGKLLSIETMEDDVLAPLTIPDLLSNRTKGLLPRCAEGTLPLMLKDNSRVEVILPAHVNLREDFQRLQKYSTSFLEDADRIQTPTLSLNTAGERVWNLKNVIPCKPEVISANRTKYLY